MCLLISCAQDPAPVSHYGVQEGFGSAGAHMVQRGDTLYSISKRYKLPMQDIAVLNNMQAPFYLNIGQRLQLPPPREYSVQYGDTLYKVSRLFGVNTYELAQLNDIGEPYVIYKGDILRIPSTIKQPEPEDQNDLDSTYAGDTSIKPVQSESLSSPQDIQEAQTASVASNETTSNNDVPIPRSKPSNTQQSKRQKITSRTPARSSSKFMQPVRGKVISSYGPKKGGLHNDGINIVAAKGTAVKAAENGTVVYVGSDLKGTGNLILVRHADRWMSAYAHLDKTKVVRGDIINRGQSIGTVGQTGSVSSPQLHFELRRGTKAINPKVYLDG